MLKILIFREHAFNNILTRRRSSKRRVGFKSSGAFARVGNFQLAAGARPMPLTKGNKSFGITASKQDLNTALIFWFFFIKEKEQHTAISRLTKQTLAKIQVKLNGIGCAPAGSHTPAESHASREFSTTWQYENYNCWPEPFVKSHNAASLHN